MRENERINFELVSRSLLAELDDRHGDLVRIARPETERLAHALRGTGCAVMLFNSRGVVIDRLTQQKAFDYRLTEEMQYFATELKDETDEIKKMYKTTHGLTEPGEQKNRNYNISDDA